MTETTFLIETLLKTLNCTQTELAEKLGVSRSQITRWKQGDQMSGPKAELARNLLGWDDGVDPEGIRITRSLENYAKWKRCFYSIALHCREPDDYYSCNHKFEDLDEFWEGMYSETLRVLDEIGVRFPKEFPKKIELDRYCDLMRYYNSEDEWHEESETYEGGADEWFLRFEEKIKSSVKENPICKLVYRIYEGSNLRGHSLTGLCMIFAAMINWTIRNYAISSGFTRELPCVISIMTTMLMSPRG